MRPTMICLHAASENSAVIDKAVQNFHLDVKHIVDQDLLAQIRSHAPKQAILQQALQNLKRILAEKPNFLLITCTNYILLLEELGVESDVPILKIDEILFEQLKSQHKPLKILFTNEASIHGTMARLKAFHSFEQEVEAVLIPEIFDWYMAGNTLAHDRKLIEKLLSLENHEHTVAVAQLSMAKAASIYSHLAEERVLSPLTALTEYFEKVFEKN